MRWPLTSKIDRVDSIDALIVLRDGSSLTPHDFSTDALDDLLRSALTFGVSALDRYVHERIVKGIIVALKKTNLNRPQEEFFIPAVLAGLRTPCGGPGRKVSRLARPTSSGDASKSSSTFDHSRAGNRSRRRSSH